MSNAAHINILHRRKTPVTQSEIDTRIAYYRAHSERLHLAILAAGKITARTSSRRATTDE